MLIMPCDYWQTTVSVSVRTDLNVIYNSSEKGQRRKSAQSQDFSHQSNLGTQDRHLEAR